MHKKNSIILYVVILLLFVAGAVNYYGTDQLQGAFQKVFTTSNITFEVSEEELSADRSGPDDSVLLARFMIKSDTDVQINNIQMDLANNAEIGNRVSALYLKYSSDKNQPKDLSAFSKIKWSEGSPKFSGLNLQVPANSDDIRVEVYAKPIITGDIAELKAVFVSFGYLSGDSNVLKIAKVDFTSEN